MSNYFRKTQQHIGRRTSLHDIEKKAVDAHPTDKIKNAKASKILFAARNEKKISYVGI